MKHHVKDVVFQELPQCCYIGKVLLHNPHPLSKGSISLPDSARPHQCSDFILFWQGQDGIQRGCPYQPGDARIAVRKRLVFLYLARMELAEEMCRMGVYPLLYHLQGIKIGSVAAAHMIV